MYMVSGIYSNIFTALNNCDSIVNLSLVVLEPEANIALPDTLNCALLTTMLNGIAIPSMANSVLNVEWTHMDNGGDGIVSGANTLEPSVNKGGLYEMTITETYQGVSCTEIRVVNVMEDNNEPIALINALDGTSLDCDHNSLILTGQDSQPTGNFSISWWFNNLPFSNDIQVEVQEPGAYTVIVRNLLSTCADTMTISIDENSDPPMAQVVKQESISCADDFITLNGSGSSVGNDYTYFWTTSDGNILSDVQTLFPEVDRTGVYVLLVNNAINGCTASDTVAVEAVTESIENVLLDMEMPSCFDESDGWISLESIRGGTAPFSYVFNETKGAFPIWPGLGAGTYPLSIEDALGCQWDTMITLLSPPPVVVELGDDLTVQLGDSVDFEAMINLSLSAIDTLIWSPDGLLKCGDCYQQNYTPLETIKFKATVIDVNGCRAEDELLIQVTKDRLIFIPNVFSPNGDGRNDQFMIYGAEGVEQVNTFQIYDRWGALVFQAQDFRPNDPEYAWDGYHKGQVLNPAVFVFYAEVLFTDGRIELFKGDITIMR